MLSINVVAGTVLALGVGFALRPVPTQAQSQADADQNAALQAVAKMMEGQRTYYQKNGQFKAVVSDLQQDFGITLPATFNYAVRTSAEAAYSYVIPAQSTPYTGQLKAYAGAAFLTPNQNPKITTIICQNTMTGQVRPADPTLARSTNLADPKILTVQCGDYSVQVPMSKVNE
ncbi:MAG: hypothetical protein IGQ88_11055 [Gloeomargaritaceae cyanobacterium C42_A2020_066]|nr:hypothetical protein [Gloeomargaritaceae cyanobacterium C42_A2020_066]